MARSGIENEFTCEKLYCTILVDTPDVLTVHVLFEEQWNTVWVYSFCIHRLNRFEAPFGPSGDESSNIWLHDSTPLHTRNPQA